MPPIGKWISRVQPEKHRKENKSGQLCVMRHCAKMCHHWQRKKDGIMSWYTVKLLEGKYNRYRRKRIPGSIATQSLSECWGVQLLATYPSERLKLLLLPRLHFAQKRAWFLQPINTAFSTNTTVGWPGKRSSVTLWFLRITALNQIFTR